MIKTSQILVILVLITTPAFGQMVHKCPGPDGKLVYQQKECAESAGATLKIETGKPSETREQEKKIQECGADLYGKIGMPISTFMVYCRDMRKLKENKETITAYGKMETLIYYKYSNSTNEYEYFIFINDKLSSIYK